jgi:hypothetical protein
MKRGFQEELVLERVSLRSYEAEADWLWQQGQYAASLLAKRCADDARKHVRKLEQQLRKEAA